MDVQVQSQARHFRSPAVRGTRHVIGVITVPCLVLLRWCCSLSFGSYCISCNLALVVLRASFLFLFLCSCFVILPLSHCAFVLSLFPLPVCCTRGPGLAFASARVLVSSTYRWARPSTHKHRGPHQCVVRALMPALAVSQLHEIANGLGCVHWLIHAAGHGHHSGDSTWPHTVSFTRDGSHQKPQFKKKWRQYAIRHGCPWFVLQRVFNAPLSADLGTRPLLTQLKILKYCNGLAARKKRTTQM